MDETSTFEIYQGNSGHYRFRLRIGTGIMRVSEAYETIAAARNGVEQAKKTAHSAPIIDLTE